MTGSLDELYEARFDEREVSAKDVVWREIARYLQRCVDPTAPVLDIACDRGHFIRYVDAAERWATDIRDMPRALPADVRFVQASGLDLRRLRPGGALRHGLHEQLPGAPRRRATRSSSSCGSRRRCCARAAA